MLPNPLYALDFDGVICDSAIETGMTGWNVAKKLWPEMATAKLHVDLVADFREIRPYLETGYEAILIMRLLYEGRHSKDRVKNLCGHYEQFMSQLLETENLQIESLKALFGETRDSWIKNDEPDWLAHNPLFTGIAAKLHKIPAESLYILTTKQERFVERILQDSQINYHPQHIYGMDRCLSKQQVLRQLHTRHPETRIVFIEDRLPALTSVASDSTLRTIHLQLADWGYNTSIDREIARQQGIEVVSLGNFCEEISVID